MNTTTTWPKSPRASAAWVRRFVFLVGLWWLLVEGKTDGWWFALGVAGLSIASLRLMPEPALREQVRFFPLMALVPRFIAHSLIGGIDVAWRALVPGLPIDPDVVTYRYRVQSDRARAMLAQLVSLMPGTLTCRVYDEAAVIHLLTGDPAQVLHETAALELRVARVFGEVIGEDVP
jgi:multicomponent Na+:H+ antiporter subunit E